MSLYINKFIKLKKIRKNFNLYIYILKLKCIKLYRKNIKSSELELNYSIQKIDIII